MLRRSGVKNRHLSEEFHRRRGTVAPVKGPAKATPLSAIKNMFKFSAANLAQALGGLR